MYRLYSFLTVLFLACVSPYFLYQAVRYKKYIGSLGQRLGYLPVSFNLDADDSIWIHAVSVGEVLTARALIPELRQRYPRLRLFVSTTTMAGQQVARRQSVIENLLPQRLDRFVDQIGRSDRWRIDSGTQARASLIKGASSAIRRIGRPERVLTVVSGSMTSK